MSNTLHALFWAGVILGVTLFAKSQGLDSDASFALVAGMTGAAVAATSSKSGRCKFGRCA